MNTYKLILLLPQDLDFEWVAKWQPNRDGIFSTLISKQHSYKDNLMICTIMLCVNYHQKQVIHHKMLLDQRILRTVWMMPLHSGGISLTGHCTVVVWFLRGCYVLYSMNSRERTWNQGDSSQCDNKNNISIEPCERIEADDAYDRMLDPIAGTPATEKPWQELLIFLLMISLEQVRLKWNNVSWLDSEDISKLALKTGMIWHLQDREFEGKKNSKQDRTSRWANRRPLMNWRRFLSKEIRRKISIVPFQCTPCTEAFWDRKIGCRVGHNFSVAANSPDVHSKAACPTIRDAKARNKLARQLKSSVLATHGTVADNWISWCLFSKQWRCMFTKRHGSVLIRIAWAIDEGRNVVWKLDWFLKAKRSHGLCSPLLWLSYTPSWCVLVNASFSVDCGWTYLVKLQKSTWELMRRTLLQQQEQFIYLNERRQVHMIPMLRFGSSFRKHSWSCSYFNSKLFTRLSDKGISISRQFDHSSKNWETIGSWHTYQLQNAHGTQGLLVYMVQDVYTHKGEWCSLCKCLQGVCRTDFTRRTIPWNVCKKTTYSRTKRIEELWLRIRKENVWKRWSECYENNFCSRRHKHSVLQTSDNNFCRDSVCVLVFCCHFSHSVILSFLSQRCDHVVNQCGWFLEWNVGKECQPMWWRFLLWLPGVHWFGVRRVQNGANKTRKETKECWSWSNFYEDEPVVQWTKRWRQRFSDFFAQTFEWRFPLE